MRGHQHMLQPSRKPSKTSPPGRAHFLERACKETERDMHAELSYDTDVNTFCFEEEVLIIPLIGNFHREHCHYDSFFCVLVCILKLNPSSRSTASIHTDRIYATFARQRFRTYARPFVWKREKEKCIALNVHHIVHERVKAQRKIQKTSNKQQVPSIYDASKENHRK